VTCDVAAAFSFEMFTALRFLLSPWRLGFMRRYGRPVLSDLRARLARYASPQGRVFVTTLADANTEFLAHALSPSGPLSAYRGGLTVQSMRACLASSLIYSVNLFARTEMARDGSELVILLGRLFDLKAEAVMLRRDALRKAPRSEEWMLYTWLLRGLGAPEPKFDSALEQAFGYQYLSYIGQYKSILEKTIPGGDE
jgi:hypothetical protein